MHEGFPNRSESETKEQKKKEYIALAKELSEKREGFPFPGIKPASYLKIKADQEEYPGYSTPIDEILEKLKTQGMKIVFGDDPNSGNVFILPLNSDNFDDNLFPSHLETPEGMNASLKKLIEIYS